MGFLNNFDAWRLGENATDFLNSMFASSTKGVAPTIVSNYSPKLPAAYAVRQEITTSPVELPEVERNVLFQDEPLDTNVKSVEETKREIEREKAARKRAAYNQAKGITTADAYAKQKELRDAGYNVTYDGYWGDASAAECEKYMKAKAANITPKMETPSLAVAPSVTKPVTTPKATDPNSPEANRQRFLDEQAAKIATAKMPSQFTNVDIIGAMKAEEARKKAELEALMQKQGAGSKLLNTDPHNIQGGYVVPVEPQYDMSKMDTHNQFGLKFYKGGLVPKHQNASGEKLEEKKPLTSTYTSGYFVDENGNPIVSEWESVQGNNNGNYYNMQREIINKNGQRDTIITNNGKYVSQNPDSIAKYNTLIEELLKKAQFIPSEKQGGSLKKCSCGCKTLLKRGKGGKVMESKNCK